MELLNLMKHALSIKNSNISVPNYILVSHYEMLIALTKSFYIYKIPDENERIAKIYLDFISSLSLEEYINIASCAGFILDQIYGTGRLNGVRSSNTKPTSDNYTNFTQSINEELPGILKLTDDNQDHLIYEYSNRLIDELKDLAILEEYEHWLSSYSNNYKDLMYLCAKLALSRKYIGELKNDLNIVIVIPVYNEHNRIRKKSELNPYGENCIIRKINSLNFLFEKTNHKYHIIIVDDGCKNKSGMLVKKIIKERSINNVTVLFLENGIQEKLEYLNNLTDTSDSIKGGAVHYGLGKSLEMYENCDYILYSDADLSLNMGQIGLLLNKMNEHTGVCSGSRFSKGSIQRFIYNKKGYMLGLEGDSLDIILLRTLIIHKMIPSLTEISDIQCGLKLFSRKSLSMIINDVSIRSTLFDSELLHLAYKAGFKLIEQPIFFYHSSHESNFWNK